MWIGRAYQRHTRCWNQYRRLVVYTTRYILQQLKIQLTNNKERLQLKVPTCDLIHSFQLLESSMRLIMYSLSSELAFAIRMAKVDIKDAFFSSRLLRQADRLEKRDQRVRLGLISEVHSESHLCASLFLTSHIAPLYRGTCHHRLTYH